MWLWLAVVIHQHLRALAAVTILKKSNMPDIKDSCNQCSRSYETCSQIQSILMDLSDAEYDALFTKDKPIIFAFHGYHTLIHELTYRRTNRNHSCISVIRRKEQSQLHSICVFRTRLTVSILLRMLFQCLPQLGNTGAYLIQQMNDKLVEHKQYIHEYGIDLPEVRDWKWDL